MTKKKKEKRGIRATTAYTSRADEKFDSSLETVSHFSLEDFFKSHTTYIFGYFTENINMVKMTRAFSVRNEHLMGEKLSRKAHDL